MEKEDSRGGKVGKMVERKAMFLCKKCGKTYALVPGAEKAYKCEDCADCPLTPMGITEAAYSALSETEKKRYTNGLRAENKKNVLNLDSELASKNVFIPYEEEEDSDSYDDYEQDDYTDEKVKEEAPEQKKEIGKQEKAAESKGSTKKGTALFTHFSLHLFFLILFILCFCLLFFFGYKNKSTLKNVWKSITEKNVREKENTALYEDDNISILFSGEREDENGEKELVFSVTTKTEIGSSVQLHAVTSDGFVLTDSMEEAPVVAVNKNKEELTFSIPEEKLKKVKEAGGSGNQFSTIFSGFSDGKMWKSEMKEVVTSQEEKVEKDFGEAAYEDKNIAVTPMVVNSGEVTVMVKNMAGKDLNVSVEAPSLNGIPWNVPQEVLNQYSNITLPVGCTSFITLDLSDTGSFAANHDITALSSVGLSLFVQADTDHDADDYFYMSTGNIEIQLS